MCVEKRSSYGFAALCLCKVSAMPACFVCVHIDDTAMHRVYAVVSCPCARKRSRGLFLTPLAFLYGFPNTTVTGPDAMGVSQIEDGDAVQPPEHR